MIPSNRMDLANKGPNQLRNSGGNGMSVLRGPSQTQSQPRNQSGKSTIGSTTFQSSSNSNNSNMRKGKQNSRPGGNSSSYRNAGGKWGRNEQNYNSSMSSNNERFSRNNSRAPRLQRPAFPIVDPENPFAFTVSDYDLEVSTRTAQAQYELYNKIVVETDITLKFDALAAISHQNLYSQQQNYNEFMEDKRQHDIERWLASMSEEDRRQYLERTKQAGSRQTYTNKAAPTAAAAATTTIPVSTSSVDSDNINSNEHRIEDVAVETQSTEKHSDDTADPVTNNSDNNSNPDSSKTEENFNNSNVSSSNSNQKS